MSQRQLWVVNPDLVYGLGQDEVAMFTELCRTWSERLSRNSIRLTYYRSRNRLDDLGISIKTVEAHRASIMDKTNSGTVADLMRVVLGAQTETKQDY